MENKLSQGFWAIIGAVIAIATGKESFGQTVLNPGAQTGLYTSTVAALTMGQTSVLSGSDGGNGRYLIAQNAILTNAGTLQSESFYVKTAGGHLTLAVYDATGANGGPGKLIASSAVFTPVTGWNTVPLPQVALSPGNYWLAYLPTRNALGFPAAATGTYYAAVGQNSVASLFPLSAASVGSTNWSLYATLTPGATPTPGSALPTPTPTPSPTSTPTPTPPPQAVAAGFTNLNFDQEPGQPWDIGYGTDGHKWNAGLWWYAVPPSSDFTVNNGVLTITATSTFETDLCTQFHDISGGTYFQGGYFEAYMSTTDWSAFWLYCADRPWVWGNLVLPSNPLTWTNEIDIIETDPGAALANNVTTTIHNNTSSDGGVPDVINPNNNNMISNGPVESTWHTYGMLWTQSQVTWYVDNVEVCTYPTFVSTWQPVQLILTAAPRGVNGSPSNVLPPITRIQWVRVWEPAGYVNPTPTP
jgi:beta-glucanase (GH16 family)